MSMLREPAVSQDGTEQSALVNSSNRSLDGCSIPIQYYSLNENSDSPLADKSGFNEPLGSRHFLYDVNVEYSPGGNCTYHPSSRFNFKMKFLPYMITNNFRKSSITSSDSSISDCHPVAQDDPFCNGSVSEIKPVDVTNATCAFLGKSEFVPSNQLGHSRVSLELTSAKLSQPIAQPAIPVRQSFVKLSTQPNPTVNNDNQVRNNIPLDKQQNSSCNGVDFIRRRSAPPQPSSPLSSRRFVNYTLLIKTIPGIDKNPAVIERRFSDFLDLYQRIKGYRLYGKSIDYYINFPKKVYMGNFSLNNIAERSIEFTRLLELCMTNNQLLWSTPFISFLIDKELKESHRLLLFGEPEDAQVTIETVYHILQKLYLNQVQSNLSANSSLISSNNLIDQIGEQSSPSLSTERSLATNSSSNETISVECDLSSNSNNQDNPSPKNPSYCLGSDLESLSNLKTTLICLNQRILVTFCMLFLSYMRNEHFDELARAVEHFCQLISYQEYMISLINTHHYITLRSCLLFLMNVNRDDIISDSKRSWLKAKLEDVDAAYADIENNLMGADGSKRAHGKNRLSTSSSANRVIKGDLVALLRNRNFCNFQDDF